MKRAREREGGEKKISHLRHTCVCVFRDNVTHFTIPYLNQCKLVDASSVAIFAQNRNETILGDTKLKHTFCMCGKREGERV